MIPEIFTATINPYALAEIVAGRKIPWKQVSDLPRLLEDIFQLPYEELFDPKYGGPLYTGLKSDANSRFKKVRSPLLDKERRENASDVPKISKIADLAKHLGVADIGTVDVQDAEIVNHHYMQLKVLLPEEDRLQRLADVLTLQTL